MQHLEPFSRVFGVKLARVIIDKNAHEKNSSFNSGVLSAKMSPTNTSRAFTDYNTHRFDRLNTCFELCVVKGRPGKTLD